MKLIKQVEAARILGVTRQYVIKLKNQIPLPAYFIYVDGKYQVDESHPAFIALVENQNYNIKNKIINQKISDRKKGIRPQNNNSTGLSKQARIAQMQDTIYAAEIKKEKALQERIKTAELKNNLAPVALMKHFFSFSDNLIQRLNKKPREISPQLKKLYLAGESKKAISLMRKEIELIVKQTQQELIQEIQTTIG